MDEFPNERFDGWVTQTPEEYYDVCEDSPTGEHDFQPISTSMMYGEIYKCKYCKKQDVEGNPLNGV